MLDNLAFKKMKLRSIVFDWKILKTRCIYQYARVRVKRCFFDDLAQFPKSAILFPWPSRQHGGIELRFSPPPPKSFFISIFWIDILKLTLWKDWYFFIVFSFHCDTFWVSHRRNLFRSAVSSSLLSLPVYSLFRPAVSSDLLSFPLGHLFRSTSFSFGRLFRSTPFSVYPYFLIYTLFCSRTISYSFGGGVSL